MLVENRTPDYALAINMLSKSVEVASCLYYYADRDAEYYISAYDSTINMFVSLSTGWDSSIMRTTTFGAIDDFQPDLFGTMLRKIPRSITSPTILTYMDNDFWRILVKRGYFSNHILDMREGTILSSCDSPEIYQYATNMICSTDQLNADATRYCWVKLKELT